MSSSSGSTQVKSRAPDIGVGKTLVPGGRCEAPTGSIHAAMTRCSLEDRSCVGMALTVVSSAWLQHGREAMPALRAKPHRVRAALRRRGAVF
jgi:hypothetical protein